jgi:hypothetical protein
MHAESIQSPLFREKRLKQVPFAIGDPSLLIVSSDACKGLENAVNAVFAHVEQMECFRHLMENYVKNYVKNYADAEHMYLAARAYIRLSMSTTRL